MLKDKIKSYLMELTEDHKQEIFKEEWEYAKKFQLIPSNVTLVEKKPSTRFAEAYIERSDKETEELIMNESAAFLQQPIAYFKQHKNEFIYLESNWFNLIGVDAVSLEADDVFGTYDVMLGLKLQKKFEKVIKEFLNSKLSGETSKFDLIFSQSDGLWDLNFALNFVEEFSEVMTIGEAYQLIYKFLFSLVEFVENSKL